MRLELRCPQNVLGITVDPDPDWNFEALLSELNVLEKKLSNSSVVPVPFAKTKLRNLYNGKSVNKIPSTFVMHVSDDDMDDMDDEVSQSRDQSLVATRRFACDDIYLSDSDESVDDETTLEAQFQLMNKVGSAECGLFELTHEYELAIKDDIRNQISAIEMELMSKNKKSASALIQVDKYGEARREMDRKLDTQYQRKIAEALDNHLTAVQRDHELKSQIEERKIRNDAAFEEAKRKEKAFQEEKLRQEKAKVEAEMQAKIRAEEAKRAALEAERRATKESAEREAAAKEATERSKQTATENKTNAGVGTSNATSRESTGGSIIKAKASALELEQRRLQKFKELDEKNNLLRLNANKDFSSHERHIGRLVRQIRGIKDNVSAKSKELIKILNDPQCPQSISIAAFAKKIVSHCESPDNAAFACGHVIVLVTAQVPHSMDILLAEFHRACIYTVPKHIVFSESAFESKDAYRKAIGYREDDGKIEDADVYLQRLESYMKLYGALVQTEVAGVQNMHGLEAGWAWLARFLNGLPANRYTAVALNAFLQAAGYALHKKYKSQFRKLLKIVSEDFLGALKERRNSELTKITVELQSYIDDKMFLKEPEGRAMQSNLLSSVVAADLDHHQSNYQQPYRQPNYHQSYQQPNNQQFYNQPYHYYY